MQEISSCSFGNDLNQLTSSSQTGFIMDAANPSQCPGNATGWHLCYYKSTTDTVSAVAYLAVYKYATRVHGAQDRLTLVPGSSSYYSIASNIANYSCSNFSIPLSQQFMVQLGDVIAACVQPSGSGRVGIVATASGSLTAQLYTGNPAITCGSPMPSTILQSKLTSTPITLHVSLGVSS